MNIAELHQQYLKSSGVCTDTRKIVKGTIFFALKGEHFDGNLFAEKALETGATLAIVDDKNVAKAPSIIYVENVLKTLQELANFHRTYLKIPIIAITGSNGKTTTKELIAASLSKKYSIVATKGNLNNHIGVPLTLLRMDKTTEIGIVEMGANHQKEIEKLCAIAEPDFGYITNFGKAHLEGFGGVEGVIKGKTELYRFLIANQKHIFINADDPIQVEKSKGAAIISFSETPHADYQLKCSSANPNVAIEVQEETIQSNLIGLYNAKNIASAVCIGLHFNVPLKAIKKAVESYIPTNNRSQIIEQKNCKIILDAYNANPTSMKAALENLDQLDAFKKGVILGDMFEIGKTSLQEHQYIVDLLENFNFDTMFVCGKNFNQTTTNKVKKYEDFEQLKLAVSSAKIANMTLLIKGSRGMALERIIEYIPAHTN